MRGKRFLDVKVVPLPPKIRTGSRDGNGGTPESQTRAVSPVRSSGSMWSINTKRLFGGSSSSSSNSNNNGNSAGHSNGAGGGSAASSAVNSPGSPMPQVLTRELDPVAELLTTKKKILFVQDVKNLIIVACDKGDSKSSKGWFYLFSLYQLVFLY